MLQRKRVLDFRVHHQLLMLELTLLAFANKLHLQTNQLSINNALKYEEKEEEVEFLDFCDVNGFNVRR